MSSNPVGQTLLDQYRVDAFLAAGGMGAVYRVWDLKRNVPLAMKVLHADLAEDPSIFKRFKREARALEKLAHPNIVPFYGLRQTLDFAFLLERYIDGPTLKDVLRQRKGKPMPVEEALVYLKTVSSALGYAHAHQVVHCDVKPGNVMVDRGGSVYLTDFGVARHAESTTTTLGFAGTATYMAPEQCRGEAVSAQTDVYALGVMLYEMLTGERPFRGDEGESEGHGTSRAERVRWAHVHLEPRDPRQVNPELSEGMAQVILKAMATAQSGRHRSVKELFEEACNAAEIEPHIVEDLAAAEWDSRHPNVVHHIPGPGPAIDDPHLLHPGRIVQRRQRYLGFVILAGIAISLVFIVLWTWGDRWLAAANEPMPGLDPSPTAQIIASELIEATAFSRRANDELTSQPTSQIEPTETAYVAEPSGKIVFTCQIFNDASRNQICLFELEDLNQQRLTQESSVDHFYASLASDGQSVVYSSNQSGEFEIYEMSISGDRHGKRLTDLGEAYAPEISPDGGSIVFTHYGEVNPGIWIMNRNGSNPHAITDMDRHGAEDPAWSPDGRSILFASDQLGKVELFAMDADGGNLRQVTNVAETNPSDGRIRGRSDWSPNGSTIASYIGDTWNWELFLAEIGGSNITLLTNGGNNLAPSFSPDGQWIAFTSYQDSYGLDEGCEIYIMRVDGTDVRRLTHNSYCDWQPRWGR